MGLEHNIELSGQKVKDAKIIKKLVDKINDGKYNMIEINQTEINIPNHCRAFYHPAPRISFIIIGAYSDEEVTIEDRNLDIRVWEHEDMKEITVKHRWVREDYKNKIDDVEENISMYGKHIQENIDWIINSQNIKMVDEDLLKRVSEHFKNFDDLTEKIYNKITDYGD